jgi:hypothetical protein
MPRSWELGIFVVALSRARRHAAKDKASALRREGSSAPSRVYGLVSFLWRVRPVDTGSPWRLAVVAPGGDREGHRG